MLVHRHEIACFLISRIAQGNCTAVALDSAMCAEFQVVQKRKTQSLNCSITKFLQNYMRQFAFSKCRGAFLYGKIVSEGVLDSKREDGGDEIFKVQVSVISYSL